MDYTCGIVEADPLAEAVLRRYITRISFLETQWIHSFPGDALKEDAVNLLFVELREVPVRSDSPFLRLVGNAQSVVVTSTYSEGVWLPPSNVIASLTKPFSFDTFVHSIELFLEKHR